MLRRHETPATGDEVAAAALQFVRKISGMRKPSKANQEAFDSAVREISVVSKRLLEELGLPARPRITSERASASAHSQSRIA